MTLPQSRSGPQSDSAPCVSISRSQSPAAISGVGGSIDSVAAFLYSLTQPLPHLLPALVDIGVQDAPSLRGLALMQDKGDWLYRLVMDHKITPLQYKHIVDGLNKLKEEQ